MTDSQLIELAPGSVVSKPLPKFAYINILRGIAVLGVLLVHAINDFKISNASNILLTALNDGRYGVQLFFFASAFTIFYSYANRFDKELHPDRNFFIRRFFRIAPLYYIAVAYYLVQNGMGPSYATGGAKPITFIGIVENLLFIHGFDPYYINSIVPGGWSIAVEMCFYCIVPFLFRKIKNINAAIYFLIITVIIRQVFYLFASHVLVSYVPEKSVLDDFVYFSLSNQLPVFAIGIVYYFIVQGKSTVSNKLLLLWFLVVMIEIVLHKINMSEHILIG